MLNVTFALSRKKIEIDYNTHLGHYVLTYNPGLTSNNQLPFVFYILGGEKKVERKKNKRKFWAMEFERFPPRFCAMTVALRKRGSGRCLLSWILPLAGFPSLASLGYPEKEHDHPMFGWRTAGQLHNFLGLMTVSPWWVRVGWVSLKPWPRQRPGTNQT